MAETLYSRKVSGFALSISTGLAFESLFPPRQSVYDPERPTPDKINIAAYDQLWVNVDTLFRNMIQASDSEAVKNTGYKEAAAVIVDEIDTIMSLMANEGGGTTSPIFYVCNYEHAMRNMHRGLVMRKETTGKQLHYKALRDKTMQELGKYRTDIKFFQGEINTSASKVALMLTHLPYDLTAYKLFGRLDLLESNTGRCKKKHQWNTKYHPVPGANMAIMPFHRFLLLVLGDKPMFQPAPSKIRNQIMETAKKRSWTPATTRDKCLLDLKLDLHTFDYSIIEGAALKN